MSAGRLHGLDALRGIAALCVLVYHAGNFSDSNAYLAVDFFFMLSGYVMARTYEQRLADGMRPSAFVGARIGKLWPTMALASLVGLPWLYTFLPPDLFWPVALANLFLIPTPMANRAYLLNQPAWSILFELIANLAHALVLWRLSSRRLALLLIPVFGLLAWQASHYTLDLGSKPETLLAGIPRVLASYGIGILLWRWWRDNPPIAVSRTFTILAMPLFFVGGALIPQQSWQSDLLFVLTLCPMLIAGGLRVERPGRLLTFAGAISFPLYAVHGPALRLTGMAGIDPWIGGAISIGLAWVIVKAVPLFVASCKRFSGSIGMRTGAAA